MGYSIDKKGDKISFMKQISEEISLRTSPEVSTYKYLKAPDFIS